MENNACQRRWLSIPEAADYGRCSRASIYARAKAGDLTIKKLGGRSIIDRHEIDALIEGSAAPATKGTLP